jgi:hypothetical protein
LKLGSLLGFGRLANKPLFVLDLIFFTYYQTEAKFSEIKNFYDRVLIEQGWGPAQQPGPSLNRRDMYDGNSGGLRLFSTTQLSIFRAGLQFSQPVKMVFVFQRVAELPA